MLTAGAIASIDAGCSLDTRRTEGGRDRQARPEERPDLPECSSSSRSSRRSLRLSLFQPVLDDPVGLHRRRRRRQPDLPGGVPRAAAHRRQHRYGRRPVPDPEAAERDPRAGLRRRSHHGVRLHRSSASSPCSAIVTLAERRGRGCRLARPVRGIARRDQGLDVPARAGLRRRHRERPDPRLPDVPVGPGTAADGDARPHRRPAHHPFRARRAVRPLRSRRPGARHRDDPRVPVGVVARHLPHGEGLQAASPARHRARRPEERRTS